MLKLWKNRTPKSDLPKIKLILLREKGHTKTICLNYMLSLIQNSSASPKPQKSHLEDEKEQDETLNYSHTSQSISYLNEEDYRLDQTLTPLVLTLN